MWLWDGLANALRMLWEVWWALVLGFTLSGIVQAWVPRRRLERALGARGARDVARATGHACFVVFEIVSIAGHCDRDTAVREQLIERGELFVVDAGIVAAGEAAGNRTTNARQRKRR